MFNPAFLKAVLERAVKTFAQALAALLASNGAGILDTDWTSSLSVAGMAAVVSILMSFGSDLITGDGPSLTNAEVVAESGE